MQHIVQDVTKSHRSLSDEATVDPVAEVSKGADLTWLLLAGVLVFFMQSGFALLESGTVRHKNYQNILLKNCMDACIGGLVWWAWGFGFAFGDVNGGFIGTKYFFGAGLGESGNYGNWFFQFAFACTAATIVSGSLAERVNINCYLLFSFFMTGFIYPVVVAWTWGGGWLTEMGYSDFAGSGIVHLTGGISGLAGAIICGKRIGKFPSAEEQEKLDQKEAAANKTEDGFAEVHKRYIDGQWDILRVHEFVRLYTQKLGDGTFAAHSPQQVVLGTLILWLGWLMFNGGSSTAIVGDSGVSA